MDFCTSLLFALAVVLAGDLIILFNAHRLVKRKTPDLMASGGEVKLAKDPVTIVRLAVGLSMFAAAGIFLFMLSQNGCLG